MGEVRLHTVLDAHGPAAALVLTDEQVAALGGTRTPPVRLTVGGTTVSARVGRMGGRNLLGLSRALRAELGVEIGDTLDATITLDDQPRSVEVPAPLAAALAADPAARSAFDALAFTHRKEYARWVGEAKRDETTRRRVEQTLARLREGRTR